jgi:hypothetical protein
MQPPEVSVVFAARAALHVLPVVQLEKRETYIRDLVLPVFRATAISWAAAKYPAREKELATACRAAAAALVAQSTGSTWGSGYAAAASRAAEYAAVVTIRDTASADAANAAVAAVDALAAFGAGLSLGFNLDLATAFGANPSSTPSGPLFPSTRRVWKRERRLPSSPTCRPGRMVNRTSSNPCGRK